MDCMVHLDMDFFYAQALIFRYPHLRGKAVAAAGDAGERHGIILAKSPEAKKMGIQTGQVIWQAKLLCPGLICVPPDFRLFKRFSEAFKRILLEHTDYVESFGIDEAWFQLSGPHMTLAEATRIVNEIRRRIYNELGLTASAGVSFCKMFAKLGSDIRKPNGITTITEENYKEVVWPLPVRDLLYVGEKTAAKLALLNVHTIGDLANAPVELLQQKLGINGLKLKVSAMGLDLSPVKPYDLVVPEKSVGNSSTAPHDVENLEHAKCLIYILAESVAARLRAGDWRTCCISVSARDTKLVTNSCQRKIKLPTNLSGEIAHTAFELFVQRLWHGEPMRSLGISCSALIPNAAPQQLDLFLNHVQREKMLALEYTVDRLRQRYWSKVIVRGIMLLDADFARVDPTTHDIHPVPMFTG